MEPVDQALREDLKKLIIRVCDVRGISPGQVADEAPMFSADSVLGLTSLDAIEIAVAVEREYKVKMKNVSSAREVFASVAALAEHIRREADPAELAKALAKS